MDGFYTNIMQIKKKDQLSTESLDSQEKAELDTINAPEKAYGTGTVSKNHEITLKGVTKRYKLGNDPNTMRAFSYVSGSSTRNEKILKLRATLLNNKDGQINGRQSAEPNTRLIMKYDKSKNENRKMNDSKS